MTRRWAMPVAAILLPGGFVLLACGWFYKRFVPPAARLRIPPQIRIPLASPQFIAIIRANLLPARAEQHCACIRHGTMRRRPRAAIPAADLPAPPHS